MSKSITQDMAYRQSLMKYIDEFTRLRFPATYPEQSAYSSADFLSNFAKQLAIHNRCSNNFPMRPLGWLSPLAFTVQYV